MNSAVDIVFQNEDLLHLIFEWRRDIMKRIYVKKIYIPWKKDLIFNEIFVNIKKNFLTRVRFSHLPMSHGVVDNTPMLVSKYFLGHDMCPPISNDLIDTDFLQLHEERCRLNDKLSNGLIDEDDYYIACIEFSNMCLDNRMSLLETELIRRYGYDKYFAWQ